jgi:predicted nucleic acid-binding protein
MAAYAYLDASALAKLVVVEAETAALENDAAHRAGLITSRLGATELRRAAGRVGQRRVVQQVEDVLAAVALVEVSPAILERAGRLGPAELRTLDAIHLATALTLPFAEMDFISYDARLTDAARSCGLTVCQPR